MSAEIFLFLQNNNGSLSQVVTHIADKFHYEIDDTLEQHISGLLKKLEQLRLIESTQQ